MSYILNALKKSEQERSGGRGPTTVAALHPPVPSGPATRKDGKSNWKLIAGGGLGVMGLLAVTVWASGPWSEYSSETSATPSAIQTATAVVAAAPEAIATEPTSTPIQSAPQRSDQVESVPTVPPMAEPDRARGEIETIEPVQEPSIGGQLARQRTPRSIVETPNGATRLVAMVLEPPVQSRAPEPPAETVVAARSAVELSEIPAPPDIPTQQIGPAPVDLPAPPVPSVQETKPIAAKPTESEARTSVAAVNRAPVDRLTLSEAADLHEKGWNHERSGDFDRAIVSFSRAIELRPDFADAYFGRAWIHDRLDELDQATADYGRAIRIEPKFAAAYSSRGVARFYLGELDNAVADFEAAMRLGRGELRRFAVLWRYLSAEHDGRDGTAQLAADTANIKLDRWPGAIARFYLGEVGEQEVLRKARDTDATNARERLCVAYFFIAQKHLLEGSAAVARDHFQSALDTGVTEFIQYKASQRELERIARLR